MVSTWINHFKKYYDYKDYLLCNLTDKNMVSQFMDLSKTNKIIGFINYDLIFRRPELLKLENFTLVLDESSEIQNETTKRCKFISKLKFKNIILLSGTPVGGKYEHLYSQLNLLSWKISKDLYYRQYVDVNFDLGIPVVIGYKNVDRLKRKMEQYGCVFMKSEEVFDLPQQLFTDIKVPITNEYKDFRKKSIIEIDNNLLVGDTPLTKLLYERMLCGHYNENKLQALKDILVSTDDRIIVFYNFNEECELIKNICDELLKPISIINGNEKSLLNYDDFNNSVTLIQYQSGSKGLNLQKANKIIYFTPTLSCENYMQSQKRIHRIGQDRTCFYYRLICENSIEERIYKTLEKGVDYTDELFRKEEDYGN